MKGRLLSRHLGRCCLTHQRTSTAQHRIIDCAGRRIGKLRPDIDPIGNAG